MTAPVAAPARARTVMVLQGQTYVTSEPDAVLACVLGSCVAVCLWDHDAGVGGMNHFLLPQGGGRSSDQLKYGANAMELLINGLLRAGAHRNGLSAKVFGGAALGNHSGQFGASNIAFARRYLSDEKIPCLAESLGGTKARRIKFWAATGRVKMLLVPRIDEPARPVTARNQSVADSITLF